MRIISMTHIAFSLLRALLAVGWMWNAATSYLSIRKD